MDPQNQTPNPFPSNPPVSPPPSFVPPQPVTTPTPTPPNTFVPPPASPNPQPQFTPPPNIGRGGGMGMRTILGIITFIALGGLAYFFIGSPNTSPSSSNSVNITLDSSSSGCEKLLEALVNSPEYLRPTAGRPHTFNMAKPFETLGAFVADKNLPDGFPLDAPLPKTFTVIGHFSDGGERTSSDPTDESYALSDTVAFCTDDKEREIEGFFKSVATPYEISKVLLDVGNTDKDDGYLFASASMPYPETRTFAKLITYFVMPAHGQTLVISRYIHDDNRRFYGE